MLRERFNALFVSPCRLSPKQAPANQLNKLPTSRLANSTKRDAHRMCFRYKQSPTSQRHSADDDDGQRRRTQALPQGEDNQKSWLLLTALCLSKQRGRNNSRTATRIMFVAKAERRKNIISTSCGPKVKETRWRVTYNNSIQRWLVLTQ